MGIDSRPPGFTVRIVVAMYLPGPTAAAVGLLALGVVIADAGWRFVRHGTVMAHEGAHAVIGSLLFRGVFGIYLNSGAPPRRGRPGAAQCH
jgi:hypothetical protein